MKRLLKKYSTEITATHPGNILAHREKEGIQGNENDRASGEPSNHILKARFLVLHPAGIARESDKEERPIKKEW